MKRKNIYHASRVDFDSGMERARNEAGAKAESAMLNDLRYLSVLNKAVRALAGAKEHGPIGTVSVVEMDGRLREFLRDGGNQNNGKHKRKPSAAYVRNVLSFFYRVARLANAVEGPSVAWNAFLEALVKQGGDKAAIPPKTQEYLRQYLEQAPRQPKAGEDGEEIVRNFARFLEEKRNLRAEGGVRSHRRAFRHALMLLGATFPEPKRKPVFYDALEDESARLKGYALDEDRVQAKTPSGKRPLFDERQERKEAPISAATWKKMDSSIRSFLRWYREKYPEAFATGNFFSYACESSFKLWLAEAYDKESYTMATANTLIDSLARVLRYGHALQLRGFEDRSEEEVERERRALWGHEKRTTKKLTKIGVNKKLEAAGGVPDYVHLYQGFWPRYQKDFARLKAGLKKGEQKNLIKPDVYRRGRDLFMTVFEFTFASRPNDLFSTIRVDNLHLIDDMYLVYYVPSKTKRQNEKEPQTVQACLPPWFTELTTLYLTEIHPHIFPGSKLLFPAFRIHKEKLQSTSSDSFDGRRFDRIRRLTKEYLGVKLSANQMRKVLTAHFYQYELMGLNRFLGHKEDHLGQKLTKVERSNYLLFNGRRIAMLDRRHYTFLAELVTIPWPLKKAS